MKVKQIKYAILIMIFCLGSCFTQEDHPPYVTSKPVCLIGNKPGFYTFAGIEFELLNTGSKTVSRFKVSCTVYDVETKKSPFIGSNIIKADFSGPLASQSSEQFIISLDPYIYAAPDDAYLIDYFYISEIVYTDGSRWTDTHGIYYTRSY